MHHRLQIATPSTADIQQRLRGVLRELLLRDLYLLKHDLHERTITHKLAEYLQPQFPEWNVDCEYNRDHHDPKRVRIAPRDLSHEDEGSNVFPDVIVHRRGSDEHNLLVIEAKIKESLDGKTAADVIAAGQAIVEGRRAKERRE